MRARRSGAASPRRRRARWQPQTPSVATATREAAQAGTTVRFQQREVCAGTLAIRHVSRYASRQGEAVIAWMPGLVCGRGAYRRHCRTLQRAQVCADDTDASEATRSWSQSIVGGFARSGLAGQERSAQFWTSGCWSGGGAGLRLGLGRFRLGCGRARSVRSYAACLCLGWRRQRDFQVLWMWRGSCLSVSSRMRSDIPSYIYHATVVFRGALH
jgi:hypothetical protein